MKKTLQRICALFSKAREPANAYTHLAGVLLSVFGLILLIHKSLLHGKSIYIPGFSIFGSSMILLYLSSTLYHYLSVSDKSLRLLRRIDHIMIYILIAGTYTPVALIVLEGFMGRVVFTAIWSIAALGVIFKLAWFNAPKWISLTLYLLMGWMALLVFPALWRVLPVPAVVWLLMGGLAYTVGAVIYAIKWPNPSPEYFNFHAIWHIMVMAGSFCFFWLMYQYVVYY